MAFRKNIKAEVKAAGKPVKQARCDSLFGQTRSGKEEKIVAYR
jgi:hypothetical protein